jgi:hypothetical protein
MYENIRVYFIFFLGAKALFGKSRNDSQRTVTNMYEYDPSPNQCQAGVLLAQTDCYLRGRSNQ